ncbi:hypothetical protein NFI96_004684 [Prochilodus magdalenae]|nr:hypothetical protein NFI96_004684 [Prochilodus magdalenae]
MNVEEASHLRRISGSSAFPDLQDQKHPQADTMSRVKEILAIALALIGWLTAIFTCVLPMWKVYVQLEEITKAATIIFEGLWMNCVIMSTGQMLCKAHDSMQPPSSDLHLARDMIVIAIITAVLPLTTSIMSAKCTNCIKDKASKVKVMIFSGGFFIITGCLVLIPVYWTRNTIIQDSYYPFVSLTQRPHKELGASLWFGFAAAALLICGGLLLCLTCISWERSTTSNTHQRIKTCAVVLGLIAWLLSVLVCVLPVWKVTGGNTGVTGVNTGVKPEVILEGLWITCVGKTTGEFQCTLNDSTLTLQLDLWAPQVMTVASIITTLLAFTVLMMGRNCCEDEAFKAKSMIVSGVFFIISGVLVLIPVSQPSNIIIQNLCSPGSTSAKHRDLGASWCHVTR